MFLGTFFHTVDKKNRVILPAKIISKLEKTIVISKGFDGCLELRNLTDFEKYSNQLMQLSHNNRESRILVRQLLANAADLNIDSSNRILLPTSLLKESNINQQIVIIGIGDKLEIWDLNSYQKFKAETDKTYEDIAEKIDQKYAK